MTKPKIVYETETLSGYAIGFDDLVQLVERFKQLDNPSIDIWDEYGEAKISFIGARPENDEEKVARLAKAKKERLKKAETRREQKEKEKQVLQELLTQHYGLTLEELDAYIQQ